MKISRLVTPLLFAAILSIPLGASAANTGGCSSIGSVCTISNPSDGTCAQNQETGDLYCQPNPSGTSAGTGTTGSSAAPAIPGATASGNNPVAGTALPTSGGGINLGIIGPYAASIINIINNILVPVLMAVAFLVFLYGVYKYFILGAGSESDREEGRTFVLYGVIGFAIIISVWGLVYAVISTIIPAGVNTHPNYPTL